MKKNIHFRKIPDYIEREISEIQSLYLIVATTLIIKEEQVKAGEFEHLGIKFVEDKLDFQKSISPQDLKGRYAKKNIDGYDIIHRNQPKKRILGTFLISEIRIRDIMKSMLLDWYIHERMWLRENGISGLSY